MRWQPVCGCCMLGAVPHRGRRSCRAGLWFLSVWEHVLTPRVKDLNPGTWTRGHRSLSSTILQGNDVCEAIIHSPLHSEVYRLNACQWPRARVYAHLEPSTCSAMTSP